MATLSFIKDLDGDQLHYAGKVAEEAIKQGVDPKLAVAIAFKESGLRPDPGRGESGEVGMMQIMPATGKGLGYSMMQLENSPEKNIEAGVKYLKQGLDATGNDPRLASIFYNGGPGTYEKFRTGQPYDPRVNDYLGKLKGYGTFGDYKPPEGESAPAVQGKTTDAPSSGVTVSYGDGSQQELNRDLFGLIGGAAGVGVVAAPYASNLTARGVGSVLSQIDQSRARSNARAMPTPPPAPTAPPAPVGGLPATPQSVVRLPQAGGIPQNIPQGGGAPATGYGTYNYGVSQGLTDIEAGRALDMTKQQGGVHDLLSGRREGMNRLQAMGANNFVENPRYGGIMTEAPSVGGGPRASFTMQPEIPPSPELPAGRPAQLSALPARQVVPTMPPMPTPPSGLDQVKNMFTGMMRQTAKVFPYIAPPLAGYSLGRDVADLYGAYEQEPQDRDWLDTALTGASALGTLGSFTPAAPLAIPTAIASPLIRNLRRTLIEKGNSPEEQEFINQPVTPQEEAMAQRPAFRYARP